MTLQDIPHEVTHAKRILVALDGSRNSEVALEQALHLGKAFHSVIYLMHVIDIYPESMSVAVDMEEELSHEAREILEKGKRHVEAEGLTCGDTIVHMGGKPSEFIVREARERDVDVIVLGSHGRTGLSRLLVGSVSERVIGHAPCPVLVVPS